MARLRIVGLGMACLDILIRAEKLPTWEGGVRLDAMAIEGGGPVATGVVASQRLGVPSGFIGTFGNDRLGEIKLQTISENGVDVSRMIKRENYEGEVVLVSVNKGNGERIFSGVASNNRQLSIDEIDKGYITQADFLHLDGFHSKAALQAAKWIKAAGGKVLLDGSATNNPIPDSMLDLVKISN